MSLPETMYELSGFSSLFEVAVGINLASSLWDGLKNNAINSFDSRMNDYRIELTSALDGITPERMCAKLERRSDRHKRRLIKAAQFGQKVGLGTCALLMGLLAFIGYAPNFEVTFFYASLFVSLSCLPILLILFSGQLYLRYSMYRINREMEEKQEDAKDMLEELKERYERESDSSA